MSWVLFGATVGSNRGVCGDSIQISTWFWAYRFMLLLLKGCDDWSTNAMTSTHHLLLHSRCVALASGFPVFSNFVIQRRTVRSWLPKIAPISSASMP